MNRKYTSPNVVMMIHSITLMVLVLCSSFLHRAEAQPFWTESFGSGCSQGQLAIAATGTNGAWTISSTGTNEQFANEWYISATEAGFPAGNCRNSCLLNAALTNQTLHVGSVLGAPNPVLCVNGDCGAIYDPGGVPLNEVTTHKRIESPVINCTGKSNITLSFNYFEGGDTTTDNASVYYFNGTAWSLLVDPPKTSVAVCTGLGSWTAFSFPLPASANNNPNVKIGFLWVNNDDAAGSNPSFAVDDITLSTPAASLTASFTVDSVSGGCAGQPRQFTDASTGSPTGWLWLFTGGTPTFSTSQNPVVTYSFPGTYPVTLVVRNAVDTDSISISNYITIVNCLDPVADFFSSDSSFCENHCIDFTDLSQNSPTHWEWSFPGSSTPVSNAQNPTNICYSVQGDYDVTLVASNANGSDTIIKLGFIHVLSCPPPVADLGSNKTGGCDTVCIDFFDLSTNNPTSWKWYFPGAVPDSSIDQNPTNVCYSSDGLYDVILIAENDGGSDTIIKYSYINMVSVPNATINSDTTMRFGDSYQLLAGGGATYYWFSPGIDSAHLALDTNFVPNPVASPAYTTTYYCLIGDGTGCYTVRQVTVKIVRDNRVFIPDAFSPNGDGQNDVFRIRGNNIVSSRLLVFDRWGEKVFETDDKNSGWDGTYKGEKLNSGVYTYVAFVIYDLKDGETTVSKETKTGTIALIR